MKNAPLYRRILSVVLVIAMLASFAIPLASAEQAEQKATNKVALELEPIDPGTLASQKDNRQSGNTAVAVDEHALTDVVRVSIVLDKASTIEAGYSLDNIGTNAAAISYRDGLKAGQAAMTAKIEQAIGSDLDVKWNLTLAANIISANVLYGQIGTIKSIKGVKDVVLENRYDPQEGEKADEPNMGPSSYMIGSNITLANGYTGAGSKVAVIDTGIDTEHISFSGEGLEYALAKTAEEKGMSYEEYVATLNLLTPEAIDAVASQLNSGVTGAQAYRSTKIAYGYNYVDKGLDITHLNDTQGEHGSHVEGIAAGNRFVKVDGEFVPALESVMTQGVAPDAQIVTMKVFGKGGGAYESDYMVAIEDAIVLGCDSANLSLGAGRLGTSFTTTYQDVMDMLLENGMVVAMSAGNSYAWYDTPYNASMNSIAGYLWAGDNRYGTGGTPGSFANTLNVASVDNAGQTGMPLKFGDLSVFYSETSGYGNTPIATLASQGELEYVFITGPGVDDNDHVGQEGDQFMALGSDVLQGKVAMCVRGTSSFFAKANAAIGQGAVAVIIVNNQPGVINMNLTDYNYTAPVVSITQADGASILAQSEAHTTESGLTYYTGTMTVTDAIEVQVPEISDTVTVSSFSSWGTPESMILKPEILAPGGSIYSVWGANNGSSAQSGHDQYELMSGTSMASPQVAGMAAVMGQYIRENNLCSKTGLTARQLTNSLLMSTAHPVFDSYGDYYAVMNVGAGLGNVGDATRATSYILMDEESTLLPSSAMDGKVKAELGDDPDRIGEYSFSFTINPMTESKEFTLSTDLFTQYMQNAGGQYYLVGKDTNLLKADVTYEINGKIYESFASIEADVNKDGKTDAADAQAILDYVAKVNDGADYDLNAADVDGDGKVTSYDAKLLLDGMKTETVTITEPTKVTVHIQLTEEQKAFLDYYYKGGAYVEGYTYVNPVATEEGEIPDATHSVVIYGYYGSWTDANMFDRTSPIGNAYGENDWVMPYLATSGNTNYMLVNYGGSDNNIYMGNPYMIEDTFPAERLALSSNTTVVSYTYMPIRNIGTAGAAAMNADGEVIWNGSLREDLYSAYYYVNGGSWQGVANQTYNAGMKVDTLGLKEGDKFTVGFYAIPEYYAVIMDRAEGIEAKDGALTADQFKQVVGNGMIGKGGKIEYTVTLDDTAPVVTGALQDLITGDIYVKASDNQYIAYVAITNKTGSQVYFETVPKQKAPGEEVEVPLELEGVDLPKDVVLLVADYAGNETAFKVNLGGNGGEEESYAGQMFGFVPAGSTYGPGSGNRVWTIDPATASVTTTSYTGVENFTNVNFTVTAAEYVDGYVFMAANDGWFYASALEEMNEASFAGKYSDTVEKIYDMAYNYKNDTMYVLGSDNTIYAMDDLTNCNLIPVCVLTLPGATGAAAEANRLAIDDNGVFYIGNYGTNSVKANLYKFELPEEEEPEEPGEPEPVVVPEVEPELVGSMGVSYNYSKGGAFAWDHNEDILYLVTNYNETNDSDHHLWTVDTTTGKATKTNSNSNLRASVRGLFIVPGRVPSVHPTDEATNIIVEPEVMELLRGQSAELKVAVLPWTLTDKDVTFESADPTIASVKDGVVTGENVGETTITVTTVAEPHLTFEVTVIVSLPPAAELRGVIWDENGKGMASVFDTNATTEWTGLAQVGQLRWGALVGDTVYGSTDDTMYAFDADTYEVTELGGIVSMWIPSDAEELPQDYIDAFAELGANVGPVIGPNNNGTYLTMLDPEAGSLIYFDFSDTFGSDPMALITFHHREDYEYIDWNTFSYVTDPDCAVYYMMTESGALYSLLLTHDGSAVPTKIADTGLDLTGVADATNSVWGSMKYDEKNDFLYVSLYNGNGDFAYLYAIDASDPTRMSCTGDFNESVWPVTGLYEYEPLTDLFMSVNPTELELFETQTAEINVKIKMGETNEYTAEIADPTICSFEDGVVTGLKEGETDITITTVDVNKAGEHLTETVHVTVKGLLALDLTVKGQVTDAKGARFTSILLDGPTAAARGKAAPFDVKSGARVGDIYLAADETQIVALDPETFEPVDTFNPDPAGYFSQHPAMDIANYPYFINADGEYDTSKALFTTNLGWIVKPDYYGWNLSSILPDMAAIAFCGTDEDDDGNGLYIYYLLTTAGALYELDVNYAAGSLSYGKLLDTGITVTDQSALSMAFVYGVDAAYSGDQESYGLVVANNEDKTLWFIDFQTREVGMVGTLEADNVSGLIGYYDELVAVDEEPDPQPYPVGDSFVKYDFEADPTNWIFYDDDGDGYKWTWNQNTASWFSSTPTYSNFAHESEGSLMSGSYINTDGVLTPDNWAYSPVIDLTEVEGEAILTFWAKSIDSIYSENFAVYVQVSGSETPVKVMDDTTTKADWTQYSIDLSDYVGQKFSVGFRNYNVTNQYLMAIDDVEVLTNIEWVMPENVEDPFKAPDASALTAAVIGDGAARLDAVPAAEVELTKVGETANEVAGGTNAIKGEVSGRTVRLPVDETTVADGNVQIILTEDQPVTNGLITVEYDKDVLTYVNAMSTVGLNAINAEEGKITFAYAAEEEIPAETALLTLNFTYEGEVDTTVTVTTLERNDDVAVEEEPVVIEIKTGEQPPVDDEEYVLTTTLKDGDQVVIYNPGAGKAMSNETLAQYYRAGKDITPVDNKVINPSADLVWTVHMVEGGFELLDAEGHKLSMSGTNNSLPLDGEHNVWKLESDDAGIYIVNVNAPVGGKNGDPRAVEWYASRNEFSGYYLTKGNADFIMELYAKTEGDEQHDCPCYMFEDMPEYGTIEHTAIDWAYTHNPQITVGTDATHFSPDATLERYQMAYFLWRVAGCPEPTTTEDPFVDCQGKSYEKAVLWMVENGYTVGTDATHYDPHGTLTIEQVLTFVWRYMGKPEPTTTENPYSDLTPDKYSYKPALWCYENGIYTGKEDGTMGRKDPCSRVQTVVILYLIDQMAD